MKAHVHADGCVWYCQVTIKLSYVLVLAVVTSIFHDVDAGTTVHVFRFLQCLQKTTTRLARLEVMLTRAAQSCA